MSAAGWTSPLEHWPRHSRPLAQEALQEARAAGWWLKKAAAKAKGWGVITCGDPETPGSERCTTSVMSTSGPQDGSETAKAIRGVLGRCPHDRAQSAGGDAFSSAEGLVKRAESCLEIVDALLMADAHRELMEDYFKRSIEAADEAEVFLTQALEAELEMDAAEAKASSLAVTADVEGQDQRVLTRQASDLADEAEQLVRDETDRRARMLRARCASVRERARTMRRLLEGLN